MAIGFLVGVQNAGGTVLLDSERKFLDPVRLIQYMAVQSAIAGPGDTIFARAFDASGPIPADWPSVLAGSGGGGPDPEPTFANLTLTVTNSGARVIDNIVAVFGSETPGQLVYPFTDGGAGAWTLTDQPTNDTATVLVQVNIAEVGVFSASVNRPYAGQPLTGTVLVTDTEVAFGGDFSGGGPI